MVPFTSSWFARWKSHFLNWRSWELNPIVIKELRQGVRSWTVTGMLLLFLVVLFLASIAFLVTQSFDVNQDLELGASMFSTFVVILAGASIFFIPLYTGVRVAAERQENNPDLLYVSTLSPRRIVFGKFLCSAYIAVLFFSAAMPFMAFTNLLRGVDLPTVLYILGFLFLVVCLANLVAIFLACLPVSRPFKFLFILYAIFQSIMIIGFLIESAFSMMRSGVGAMMSGRDFWINTATAILIGLLIAGLFFVLSVALISPPSANRARPVRLYLTAIWLLGGAVAFVWVLRTHEGQIILGWMIPTLIVAIPVLLATISNADTFSLRVRRTIPRSLAKRCFAFLVFNGAAGGLLWLACLVAGTCFLSWLVMAMFPTSVSFSASDRCSLGVAILYAFAYALTGLFIHRKLLPRSQPRIAGLLAILLAGGWAILPSVVLFFVNQLTWKSVDRLQLGNIFNVFTVREDNDRNLHLVFAVGWLAGMLLINGKWFLRQLKYFRPLEPVEPPPVIAEQRA